LSTTHCIVGALAGVYLAGKSDAMRHAYLYKTVDETEIVNIQGVSDDDKPEVAPRKDESS